MPSLVTQLSPLIAWMLHRRWFMISGAVISSLIVIAVTVAVIVLRDWQFQSDNEYQGLVRLDQEIMSDIDRFLGGLNRQFPSNSRCTDKMLRAMNQAEFHSNFLHEFSLIKNDHVICTSSQGLLAEPHPLSDHDMSSSTTGITYTREAKVPLMEDTYRSLIRLDNFQGFLRKGELTTPQYSWIKVAEFQRIKDQLIYIAGYDEILPQRDINPETQIVWYENNFRVTGQCFRPQTCALVIVDIAEYFRQQVSLSLMTSIITLLGVIMAAALASHLYQLNRQLPRRLRRELNADTIICNYQPIVDLHSQKIVGCEVLCRWQPDVEEVIFPDVFLPLIEANKQTEKLTQLVIIKALEELREAGISDQIRIAFNAFPADITAGSLLPLLQKQASDLLTNITIELTERETDDKEALIEGIRLLRQQGIKIAIDDFGTGYSNFQHLRDLHIDYLKIDKSFVWSASLTEPSLLTTIIDMAKQLELSAIAEGVENTEQSEFVSTLGVEFGQGYLYARPLSIADFKKLIQNES